MTKHKGSYSITIPIGMTDILILFGTPRFLRWATLRVTRNNN